jgi:hypothetical protein
MASIRTSPFGVNIQRGKKRKSVFWFGQPEENLISVALDWSADGTRPQPMPSEIKNYLALSYFSGRDWSTEVVQSSKQIPLSQGSRLAVHNK